MDGTKIDCTRFSSKLVSIQDDSILFFFFYFSFLQGVVSLAVVVDSQSYLLPALDKQLDISQHLDGLFV